MRQQMLKSSKGEVVSGKEVGQVRRAPHDLLLRRYYFEGTLHL